MPTHNQPEQRDGQGHEPEKHEVDASAGYERTDANVVGIVVFLTALAIFAAVTGLLCYGIGKVINAHLDKEDGPNSKWTKTAEEIIEEVRRGRVALADAQARVI